jgi:hypothetical protein
MEQILSETHWCIHETPPGGMSRAEKSDENGGII